MTSQRWRTKRVTPYGNSIYVPFALCFRSSMQNLAVLICPGLAFTARPGMVVLESEPRPQLQGARVLVAIGDAETSILRQVSCCSGRQVGDCGVGQAGELHARVHASDVRLVERVESVKPHYQRPRLAELNGALQRHIVLLEETAAHVVRAGLQPDAALGGWAKRAGVELRE